MNFPPSLGSFLNRAKTPAPRDPARDWIMLLTVATIAFAGIVVWNVWAFDTVANGGTVGASATSTPAIFDESSLGAIRAIFADRAVEEAKYVSGEYQYADPSR